MGAASNGTHTLKDVEDQDNKEEDDAKEEDDQAGLLGKIFGSLALVGATIWAGTKVFRHLCGKDEGVDDGGNLDIDLGKAENFQPPQ